MNKYNSLLIRIATELGICKGTSESDVNYKSRLIYSAVSRIGYASLWDKLEDNVPVSIEHFKRRVENTLNSYLKMYPEVQGIFPDDQKIISESMYNTLLATGNLYHSPKRISPPMRVQAGYDKIVFLRGTSLSEKISISGIGTYAKSPENCGNTSVQDMFGLTKNAILDYWRHYSEIANWTNIKSDEKYEFLNIQRSYSQSYWKDKPDKNTAPSLMRTVAPGTKIYYLYRYKNNALENSQLPYWLTDDNRYLYLSNGLLASENVLPPITYRMDGAISYLKIGYLLPPAEQNLIMLYSWPKIISNVDSSFSRIIDTDVLKAIIGLLNKNGFIFKEE